MDSSWQYATLEATILLIISLAIYTSVVWNIRIRSRIKKWHLVALYFGLLFQLVGVIIMDSIPNISSIPDYIHPIVGLLPFLIMLLHTVWINRIFLNNGKKDEKTAVPYSFIIWAIWLVLFLISMYVGALIHP